MTAAEYSTEVRSVLDAHSAAAQAKLDKLLELLPDTARAIHLMIFIDQDGEGFLSIRISLEGPDLHVINRAIDDCAELFDTVMGEDGLVPPLPLMDPFEEDFSVHDELADSATDWLVEVTRGHQLLSLGVPVSIFADEEHGKKAPHHLTQNQRA